MKINLTKIFSVLFLLFSTLTFSQSAPETVRIDAPVWVAVDSPFEISVIHNFETDISKKSLMELSLPEGVSLESVQLRNGFVEESLPFEEDGSLISVKLYSQKSKIDFLSPVQIVFAFNSEAVERENIELTFISDGNFSEWTETIPIDFYVVSEKAGGAAALKNNSWISIQPDGEFASENLTVEFWGKFDSAIGKFFSVVNRFSSDTLLTIDNGSLNILGCQTKDAEVLCESFLSPDNWYHFAFEILQSENIINFYVNGEKVIQKSFFESLNFGDLLFVFQNSDSGKVFQIDELHIWTSDQSIVETLEKNAGYAAAVGENSKEQLSFDFNNKNELSNNYENFLIGFNSIEIEDSDAPLFTRAPSIDVEQFSGYNLIKWKSKDETGVSEYVVEKSSADGRYEDVFFKESAGADEEYYYSDYRDAEDGVVYYRIKQINGDGSVVYSPSVKIGLRELKEFEIVQNFPNPFNPSTNISVNILVAGEYRIRVYNVTGKVVTELEDGFLSTGTHEYTFNGAGLTSGIYFFEIKSQTSVRAIKMIMTK
ncbi:MAG: T9SS type A sorting domain-containing protein [Chlorobi bacterium]|nr:T9SS type A sorting domain-containing protein [Chlorobiota bacterium]